MKKLFNYIPPVLFGLSLITGCIDTLKVDPKTVPERLQDKLIMFGNPESDKVLIHTQGGPLPHLANEEMLDIFRDIDKKQYLLVNVHQAHTYAPDRYEKPIDFEFAKQTDQKTTKMLADTVRFFKDKGKQIYVIGLSFGAFVVQDLLVEQGPIADGYLIMVGRLDMPSRFWSEFSRGHYVGFDYAADGSFEIKTFSVEEAGMGGSGSISDQNMARLAAGLGYKRYTELLRGTDLSKVVYVYGTRDEQVGRLSPLETEFLKSHHATLLTANKLDHSGTINAFFNTAIKILLNRD